MLSTILIWENRKMEKAGLVESPENEVVDAPAEIRSEPEKFKLPLCLDIGRAWKPLWANLPLAIAGSISDLRKQSASAQDEGCTE
ncbi:hypothetical protein M8818_007651 [Zalaria obscura]|uniref:Uncharacterized protein n=1 Tax=Zalaria obscura TaxID=2024903 RepID=A0ACC3S307_9PEZI